MPPASPDPDPTAPLIGPAPDQLVHQFDPTSDRIVLLEMSEADYRRASFLDQRAVAPGARMTAANWTDVASAVAPDWRRDAQFIFHIGNVGSTLISRLLGELDSVFALREPLLLRSFAEMLGPLPPASPWPEDEAEARVGAARALLSRTFRSEQRAIVKATSFTSEIAARMIPAGSRALFLFATPDHYIENILAGPNSRQTLAILGPSRLARLQTRCAGLSVDLAAMDEARRAALAWACEATSLTANSAGLEPDAVLWFDFDRFLEEPTAHLGAIAAHFGIELDQTGARRLVEGPLMRRYSKALEYEFTPGMRREILAQSRREHGTAISGALRWLEELAGRYPAVAQAIRRTRT
ncbi:hypothetical protein [Sphingosinicella terrae]|uniref:hypothetical protein n=1 Tax=Sphingosinicella terrae TaxID=2172047 RepID=UPI000E0DA6B3|nr:hypothetical protein [Sphingosinicella terrae]